MKYAHLLSAFYGQPWHIRQDVYANFSALLQSHIFGTNGSRVIRADLGEADSAPATAIQRHGPVAVVPVHGALGRHLSMMDLMCGGCDYAHLSTMFAECAADPSIGSVIVDFNSPGGMSAGCSECAADLAALAAQKPVLAYTSAQCCSAAYWLASQCREIWAAPSATVGSIGTIICAVDNSQQWANEGLRAEIFASSPLKATGADGKPWTPEDRAYLQERLDQADARFKSAVRAGRPQLSPKSMDGRWFFAADAPAGIVDGIEPSLDAIIAEIASTF